MVVMFTCIAFICINHMWFNLPYISFILVLLIGAAAVENRTHFILRLWRLTSRFFCYIPAFSYAVPKAQAFDPFAISVYMGYDWSEFAICLIVGLLIIIWSYSKRKPVIVDRCCVLMEHMSKITCPLDERVKLKKVHPAI